MLFSVCQVSSVKMSSFVTFGLFHADSIADTTTIPVSDNEMRTINQSMENCQMLDKIVRCKPVQHLTILSDVSKKNSRTLLYKVYSQKRYEFH